MNNYMSANINSDMKIKSSYDGDLYFKVNDGEHVIDYNVFYDKNKKLKQVVFTKYNKSGVPDFHGEYNFSWDEYGFLLLIDIKKKNYYKESSMIEPLRFNSQIEDTSSPIYDFTFNKKGMMVKLVEKSFKDNGKSVITEENIYYDNRDRMKFVSYQTRNIDDENTHRVMTTHIRYDENGGRTTEVKDAYSNPEKGKIKILTTTSVFDNKCNVIMESIKTQYFTETEQKKNSIRIMSQSVPDNGKFTDGIYSRKTIYQLLNKNNKIFSTVTTVEKHNKNKLNLNVEIIKEKGKNKFLTSNVSIDKLEFGRRADTVIVSFNNEGLPEIQRHYDYENMEVIYVTQYDANLSKKNNLIIHDIDTGEDIYDSREGDYSSMRENILANFIDSSVIQDMLDRMIVEKNKVASQDDEILNYEDEASHHQNEIVNDQKLELNRQQFLPPDFIADANISSLFGSGEIDSVNVLRETISAMTEEILPIPEQINCYALLPPIIITPILV